MSDILVDIQGLSKVFVKGLPPALDKIDATIPRGEIVGLAGPDGAGKTTLIRLIAGLLLPTTGSITIAGHDTIKDAKIIHEMIGYMPQKFGLYEDLTVMENLQLYADLRGLPSQDKAKTFDKLLNFTGLGSFQGRLAGKLSGGMMQKLGLACALVVKPEILLLDEPSVGVDPISRRELWKMVQNLLGEGITVLWSTAYLEEAERCHTVLLLNEGKLLYYGPPAKLAERVKNRVFKIKDIEGNRRVILERALSDKNVIDGVIQGEEIRIVTAKEETPPFDTTKLDGGPKLEVVPTEPRFEDAFVDILGGADNGESLLAKQFKPISLKNKIVVKAEHLTKKFGSFTAASDISFEIGVGEIFGLLGPNGAGKTTTFKMMCGLLQPTSGKASVNGLDLQAAPGDARSNIGYMAQKFSLYGNLSLSQNLEFFSGIYNLRGARRQKAMEEMVEVFGFKPYLDTSAETLSLGYKKRLALSCAVMHQPAVLFLDEPSSGVDPLTRREFWTHINGLVLKGVTVMVTTHFMDEAEYCDRIALVYRGKIIYLGTPDALKTQSKTKENPDPTLEDAFVYLIEDYDKANPHGA